MNENGIFNLIYNNIKQVYGALIKTLQNTPNFELAGEEPAIHAVHVVVGKTMFSSGDELTIKLEAIDDNKTKMQVTADVKVGAGDNLRARYGDVIQKLVDKMKVILPPPVMEEAPKPNNMVQVGELSRQMNTQPNGGVVEHTPTSVSEAMSAPLPNNVVQQEPVAQQNNNDATYAYEPKPFDYESLKENESSKHQGNDPLQDLMKNL